MTTPLHRHQLALLSADGWADVLQRDWDEEALACLRHWAQARLPLVVTRQSGAEEGIALGLPAPTAWGRRRLALRVRHRQIACFDEFPNAADILALLPRNARAQWRLLMASLAACGVRPRVHGSYGWQRLSGLPYVRAGSDIDLWIAVDGAGVADRVAMHMKDFAAARLRLDCELVFGDGSAAHWREWMAWRAGQCRSLLVKRMDGAMLAGAIP
jgi:phosphoribosyl-dephospho-CoA transferase